MLPGMPDFKSLGAGFDKLLSLLAEIEHSLRRIADALGAIAGTNDSEHSGTIYVRRVE